MEQIKFDPSRFKAKSRGPTSKRGVILEQIAELLEMDLKKQYWSLAGKVNHLQGERGTNLLKSIYEEAMMEDDKDGGKWRRIKFWQLLKKTHVLPD